VLHVTLACTARNPLPTTVFLRPRARCRDLPNLRYPAWTVLRRADQRRPPRFLLGCFYRRRRRRTSFYRHRRRRDAGPASTDADAAAGPASIAVADLLHDSIGSRRLDRVWSIDPDSARRLDERSWHSDKLELAMPMQRN
jgi:hypothetical protein